MRILAIFERNGFLRFRMPFGEIVLLSIVISSFNAQALSIEISAGGSPYLTHDNSPVFGYGASPQNILTYLPKGNGNDYVAWVHWAEKYMMNHVRSYPPSIVVPAPAINLFEFADEKMDKFDLSKFNDQYFNELQRACRLLKEKNFSSTSSCGKQSPGKKTGVKIIIIQPII